MYRYEYFFSKIALVNFLNSHHINRVDIINIDVTPRECSIIYYDDCEDWRFSNE